MSNEKPDRKKQPLRAWLPTVILKLLVFLTFAFVLFEATVGLGEQELGSNRVWVIVVSLAGLLLLLAIDRLTGLRVSPRGVEATLAEAKMQALGEISGIEDHEAAEAARAEILQAQSAEQVQAAMAVAVELNVDRVVERAKEAIRAKRKLYVRYRPDPDELPETYLVAPLDIKPGKTPATRANDYLWVHSYEHESTLSLRLGRVLGVELSEESFDPAEVMAGWKKKPEWNVKRDW
jgi:hypothetical protein